MKHTLLLTALMAGSLSAQTLSLHWALVRNDAEPGVLEARLTLVNHTPDTLTADGSWLIGYCQMSAHPLFRPGDQLQETEVCASFHTLTPTASFLPLAPGESRTFALYQRGAIVRQNGGPEGAFFVASEGAQPVDVPITYTPFSSPLQWTRKSQPGYADGAWMYAYNAPFCERGVISPALRPLGLVPEPKSVAWRRGKANLQAPIVRMQVDSLPAEGYRLTLSPRRILLEASSPAGFFYGEQTLQRLRENNEPLASCCITDWPDLPHRGLMLDIVRNYTPLSEMRRILRVMAAYKLNVFHLHLADDEGWRLEIPGLPELTTVASRRGYTLAEHGCLYPAYCGGWDSERVLESEEVSSNGFLSRADYVALVRYADSLHITVIPEIEMPGHARAAIRAMEERHRRLLIVSPDQADYYRLLDPCDTSHYLSAQHYTDDVICIARPSALRFMEKVITELIAMHQEAGQPLRTLHVGGDEVASGAWEGSPICQQRMQEEGLQTTHELKDWFLSRLLAFLRPRGIRLAGWEEIAMRGQEVNPAFLNDQVISWCWNSIPEWAGDEKPYLLANAGYPVVLACVGNLYLDMSYTHHEEERGLHWGGYTDEHSTFDILPYDLYRSVRYTLQRQPRDINAYDAQKNVRLLPSARQNILGINGQLFAETIRSTRQLEEYIFPKLPGLAERAWNATPLSCRTDSFPSSLTPGTQGDPSSLTSREDFEQERLLFSRQLYHYELPRLSHVFQMHFHLAQPGITLQSDTVFINCPVPGAAIHYTLDGSDPTPDSPLYTTPFPLPTDASVRARAFFLGERSNATRL